MRAFGHSAHLDIAAAYHLNRRCLVPSIRRLPLHDGTAPPRCQSMCALAWPRDRISRGLRRPTSLSWTSRLELTFYDGCFRCASCGVRELQIHGKRSHRFNRPFRLMLLAFDALLVVDRRDVRIRSSPPAVPLTAAFSFLRLPCMRWPFRPLIKCEVAPGIHRDPLFLLAEKTSDHNLSIFAFQSIAKPSGNAVMG